MKEKYEKLTQYKKTFGWKNRFGSLYRLYTSKLTNLLFKDRKTWIFNVLMLLPIIAGPIFVIVSKSFIRTPILQADYYMTIYSDIIFLGYFGILIPLFSMYIASMMFSDEKGNRSITYIMIRPINRFEIIITKYLSYLSFVPIFIMIIIFLNYITFGIVVEFTITAFNMFDYYEMALWFLLVAFISSAVYGALFMFIGLLFENPLWFGLFFVFIWEFVLASFSQALNKLTIGYYIKSLLVFDFYRDSRNSPIAFIGTQASQFKFYFSPAKALSFSIVLLVVVIISITLAWAVLKGDKFRIPYKVRTRPGGWKYYLKEIRSYLITFSVLFLTIGTVLGPVSGIKKDVTDRYNGDIYFSNDDWWYHENDYEPPNLDQMVWGHIVPYTLTEGTEINVEFTVEEVYGVSSYILRGVICTEEVYNMFYRTTQQRWLLYGEIMDSNYTYLSYFLDLINDYNTLAFDFLNNVTDSVTFTAETTGNISFKVEERGNYYFVALPQWFILEPIETAFITRDIDIFVIGQVSRRPGFVFGNILLDTGIITICIVIYSLAIYNSAIEIQRYENKITNYQKLQSKNDENSTNEIYES